MTHWFREFAQRLVWASKAFVADGSNPVIQLENGISLDLTTNRIILSGDLSIHVTGNMSLTSDGRMTVEGFVNNTHVHSSLPSDTHFVDRYLG